MVRRHHPTPGDLVYIYIDICSQGGGGRGDSNITICIGRGTSI